MRPLIMLAPITLLAALPGCQPDQPAAQGGVATTANEAAAPGNAAIANAPPQAENAAAAMKIAAKDDLLDFDYGWPAAAAAIPPLDQWLRDQAAAMRARAATSARSDAASARKQDYPFRGHSFSENWSTVADTAALLVLQADGYTFTGGAHGNPFVATLIWDKAAAKRLATAALLDVPALARIEHDRFCAALDAQRTEKRGPPEDQVVKVTLPEFNDCVNMAEQEVVPISRGGAALDTIRVVILPYSAGPYVEGIYTIELPLRDADFAAIKPAYRAAFARSAKAG